MRGERRRRMKKKARQYGRPDVLSGQDIRGSPVPEDLAPFFLEASSVPLSLSLPLASRTVSLPYGVFSNETFLNGESYVLEDIGYVTQQMGKLDFPDGTRPLALGPVDWMIRAIPADTKPIEFRFQDQRRRFRCDVRTPCASRATNTIVVRIPPWIIFAYVQYSGPVGRHKLNSFGDSPEESYVQR